MMWGIQISNGIDILMIVILLPLLIFIRIIRQQNVCLDTKSFSSYFKMKMNMGKNFKIIKKIGKGSFGQVFHAINTKTSLQVAIKTEKICGEHSHLMFECSVYTKLLNDSPILDKGIPNIYYFSRQGNYNMLVMDLMGPSLNSLFYRNLEQFSLKTVLMLADQMISRIELIHSQGFIHQDIKPENFCIGTNRTSHKIFLIDFGLTKRYIQRNGKHIEETKGYNVGTRPFASINTHFQITQSRRDDMESIGYVLMSFLRGTLPWQWIEANDRSQKWERTKEKKLANPPEVLCKGYPPQFARYLITCRNLKFDEAPNYSEMRNMFKGLLQRSGYKYDYQYDWVVLEKKKKKHTQLLEKPKQV